MDASGQFRCGDHIVEVCLCFVGLCCSWGGGGLKAPNCAMVAPFYRLFPTLKNLCSVWHGCRSALCMWTATQSSQYGRGGDHIKVGTSTGSMGLGRGQTIPPKLECLGLHSTPLLGMPSMDPTRAQGHKSLPTPKVHLCTHKEHKSHPWLPYIATFKPYLCTTCSSWPRGYSGTCRTEPSASRCSKRRPHPLSRGSLGVRVHNTLESPQLQERCWWRDV